MPKSKDKLMWTIIESLDWDNRSKTENRAYETIKMEFLHTYTKGIAKEVGEFIGARSKELYDAYDKHETNGGERHGNFGGDDSFSDMMHHVIGMGRKTFEAVMNDMSELDNVKYVESFSYAIPHTCKHFDDYKMLNADQHDELARKGITELSDTLVNQNVGHEDCLVALEIMTRLIQIRAGDFPSAVGDLDQQTHYNRYTEFGHEYGSHALYANILFDAKKYMIDAN